MIPSMERRWILAGITTGAIVGAIAVVVRRHIGGAGRAMPGGIVMGDVPIYDVMSRVLLGSFYRSIAADVARAAAPGARILEVGCGPGHLSVQMASEHGLEVTGLDLDPAMIERARANAARMAAGERQPKFVVGDASALPFAEASFDLVVSTLSMHHWDNATAGLTEIARVVQPGGKALIWDVRPGVPVHSKHPDPSVVIHEGPMSVVGATPWRWPWGLSLTQRFELAA
jgi:SAM-dependent methyltransferase